MKRMRTWSGKHWYHPELAKNLQTIYPPRKSSVDKTKTLAQDTPSPEKSHQKNETLRGKTPDNIRDLGTDAKKANDNISTKKVKMLKRQDAMSVQTLKQPVTRCNAVLVKTLK